MLFDAVYKAMFDVRCFDSVPTDLCPVSDAAGVDGAAADFPSNLRICAELVVADVAIMGQVNAFRNPRKDFDAFLNH